ncbi:MAG: GGDEF domain-containing protein [Hoeflea sp.]|uniref:GGDEF domain-containing protein n=1 Tax=Hoeflea sp. TaxID=1940281 RepID=UPI001D5F525E|nr:GGDEF domain-containing protein [Hoeflea sp.]MBU4530011.1 GGDEF domain-containing protein [Alphaproteobacteria bacterium]MBU4543238.1 GGDEF domain-containing protein [Alphaproteobacteria bacterium]MBU4550222.1 GGDEF domain-containing protein [Alphaproteobacteria bacterium]MBV1722504.1 GGDEF domain-containing protein [Hoeflea sp.]MBV1761654.1 GGDEF domain-containing protein [Hoeflea sp.]
MVGVTRNWIVKQLMLGEFRSYRDVCRKSVWVGVKVSLLAYCLNLAAHFLIHGLGLLPYSLGEALIVATLLTPPITFILAVGSYMAVGFAIHDLGVSRAELERLSRTDMLSGLANRRAFQDAFDKCELDKTLVVFDIDRFKTINDTHGHSSGDAAIAEVATILSAVFGERCLCARIGGEEFAVFSSDIAFAEFAALAEIARVRISRLQISADAGAFGITVSGGIARARAEQKFGESFSRADKALYAAKAAGRDRISVSYPTDDHACDAEPADLPVAKTHAA